MNDPIEATDRIIAALDVVLDDLRGAQEILRTHPEEAPHEPTPPPSQ